ncbi:unnamed protein product [Camellia sinensis]
MGFDDFEPIFGQAKAEWSTPNSPPLRPFLFNVHVSGSSCLKVHVSDFYSNTFEAVRSIEQLEDLRRVIMFYPWMKNDPMALFGSAYGRDMIGIGGSWCEFMDYLVASIKSDDVKLILDGQPRADVTTTSECAAYAKLVAQKSKGMPLISISLAKLVDANASEVMANLSLEEQDRCCLLTKVISAEQEKTETIQKQLDTFLYSKRQKSLKMNDKSNTDALSATGLQDSPDWVSPSLESSYLIQAGSDKLAAQNPGSTKVAKRVVPAYRRSKVRGVLLQDTTEDGDN